MSDFIQPPSLLQSAILYFSQRPTTGSQLRSEIGPLKLAKTLTGSPWHRAIDRCLERGWLTKTMKKTRINTYQITKEGKEALAIAVNVAKVLAQ